VLDFFLDGMPPLDSPTRTATADSLEASNHLHGAVGDSTTAVAATGSFHPNLNDSECSTCHDAGQSYKLLEAPENLCKGCHDKADKKVVHAPVEAGDCGVCHNPHGTEHAALLRMVGAPLCFQCHEAAEIGSMETHKDAGDMVCTECHNPHSADDEHLMR
jgi:predicted CXXCH cytochrome family protein